MRGCQLNKAERKVFLRVSYFINPASYCILWQNLLLPMSQFGQVTQVTDYLHTEDYLKRKPI